MFKRTLLLCAFCFGCTDGKAPVSDATEAAIEKPNVVLFLTDDQGWGDVGFNGNEALSTPHINQIAEQGVSFERFYVNPVCSPTRAALLTGRQPLRTGVFSVTRGGEKMRSEELTLAEALQQHGYATGLFGKWHNGAQYPHDPTGQGFDEYLGFVDGHQTLYFDAKLLRNGEPVETSGYIADVTTDAAIDFIQRNHQQPFFAYVPFNTPHSPFELPDNYFRKYKDQGLSDLDASIYGMVENIDDNVGRVLAKLDELNLSDNTLVIFLSDNGPAFPGGNSRYNGNLKGHKGRVDEGGVRVPMFIHWPNHIEGGHQIQSIAQHMDIYPTVLSLLGAKPDPERPLDGDDISPLLLDSKADDSWPDRTIYTNHFRNTRRENEQAIAPFPGSIRTQQWLAVYDYDGQWYLFDIQADPQQSQDLANSNPSQLNRLKADYMTWYHELTASPVQTIAIEVGHAVRPAVTLSAHEAHIEGQAIDYAFEAGWAHDWSIVRPNQGQAQLKWPVKVVSTGSYTVIMEYATPNGAAELSGSLQLASANLSLSKSLAQYAATEVPGKRLYYTDEAPDLQWRSVELGKLQLTRQSGDLLLRPEISGSELHIKSIRLERVD
ncbi:arylsulfatase [Neiella marina]|uniref:Arylsulfatase n=1 Tax=Neiella marina TaxID=508461 RepID=A0A8J2XNE9_9GAMM|nr:arylsulfatase [Neiella marina]GGA72698.1 arylsulfatase [Neiella marina]